MKKFILGLGIVVMTTAVFSSCILDPEKKKDDKVVPPPSFRPLTEKDNVLFNLEQVYNQRNFNEYDKLLDANFTFHFAQRDLDQVESPTLDRAQELNAAQNMFNPAFSKPGVDPIISIDMSITYAADNWIAVTAPPEFAGETWHQKIVDYFSVFEAPPNTYTSQNTLQAIITIRPVDVDGVTNYRIVEWKDDIGGG